MTVVVISHEFGSRHHTPRFSRFHHSCHLLPNVSSIASLALPEWVSMYVTQHLQVRQYGAVQLLRNAFLANFDPPPSPLVTKCHTGLNPPPPP